MMMRYERGEERGERRDGREGTKGRGEGGERGRRKGLAREKIDFSQLHNYNLKSWIGPEICDLEIDFLYVEDEVGWMEERGRGRAKKGKKGKGRAGREGERRKRGR
jgi:hypothetical protein